MTTKKTPGTQPVWTHEWVALNSIIKHPSWQMRAKLDAKAVKRYAEMTAAGSQPPPIKVGRVDKHLYLLDGWHRMEAGALKKDALDNVFVEIADLNKPEAIWEAAKANLDHGVQYKPKDLHSVFKAFITSKKYLKPNGRPMSYREMAPILGKGHTTIRTWMLKFFPKLARELGGKDHGNEDATMPPLPDFREEHYAQSVEALLSVTQRLNLITPEDRWKILQSLDQLQQKAMKLGVKEPHQEDF